MRFVYTNFIPHKENDYKARLLRHSALIGYLAFLLAVFALIQTVPIRFPGVLGYASDITIGDLLAFTNNKRAEDGVSELRLDPVLSAAAYDKAKDMFEDNYWAHVAPDGTEPWYFILNSGYDYLYAGENLAKDFNTSQGVVEAWMNSPSHRENLISAKYTDIGFAVVDGVLNGYETTLVVQMFGKRKTPIFLASNEPAVPAAPAISEVPEEEAQKESAPVAVVLEGPSMTGVPVGTSNQGFLASLPAEIVNRFEERGTILPAVDVFKASRSISLVVGIFIFSLLAMDAFVTLRRGVVRISGNIFAHSLLLILSILALWFVSLPGLIL